MMALPFVAVGAKITASFTNAIVSLLNLQGQAMVPTSIAGTGGAVNAYGTVTASLCTGVSINGTFTAAYENYRIIIRISTLSAAGNISLRFRSAGTDNTAAVYDFQLLYGNNTTVVASQTAGATSWAITLGTASNTFLVLDVFAPAVVAATGGLLSGMNTPNPVAATTNVHLRGLLHDSATAFDGFTITPSAGTFSGTVKVISYNS